MLGAWLSVQLPVGALAMRLSRGELEQASLVQAVQAGEAAAITRALDLCLPLLRRVAAGRYGLAGDEVEEVMQETRLAFWRAARNFRGDSSLRTFLVQIACRQCGLFLRAKARREWEPLEDDPPARGAEIEVMVDRLAVEEAVKHLSPRQQQVLELFYGKGWSYQEIALSLGIDVGTVASTKAEALQRLRRELGDSSGGAGGPGA